MNGTTFKTCSCRDEATGKKLGKTCPKLRRPGGGEWWSSTPGRWAYQLELPAHADGRRRNPLRRRGFATLEEVEAELEHARALLALDEDPHVQRKVTELMLWCSRTPRRCRRSKKYGARSAPDRTSTPP
ncbi:hypothetical protein [Nonomuraea jabiensis]|uniref:AP2-like integrase N-terminal domain-containing protein n=1 Tax=Nonomuraea jabiensis TaxID=882448 RepID=A0A7W9LD87_9ACTN|nr:hypothetical protein [Nonomuraea jabiensis]MBB5779338.1 hypothetical protein [Nonomuraea jabiensis]